MPIFDGPIWNQDGWNQDPDSPIIPPSAPVATISTPLAPRPQQLTNASALINGGYKEAGVIIFRNGVLLTDGLDYTRIGGIVNLVVPPGPGDIMTARVFVIGKQLGSAYPERYVTPWTLRLTGAFDDAGTLYEVVFGPTINGMFDGRSNLITWGVSFQRVQIWRNGVFQTIAQDYAAGPTAAVFYPASIPQPGDLITILGYNGC